MAKARRLQFSVEPRGDVTILRYSGTHACRDEDHALDDVVREQLARAVTDGCSRYLFDVRELEIVFSSSAGDLVRSWPAISGSQMAILCKPMGRTGERLAMTGGLRTLRFFSQEAEALAFLHSRDAGPPTEGKGGGTPEA